MKAKVRTTCTYRPCGRYTLSSSSRCGRHRGIGFALCRLRTFLDEKAGRPGRVMFYTGEYASNYLDESGVVTVEERTRNGVLHRLDGPAKIVHRSNFAPIAYSGFFVHGMKHRVGGPAETVRRKDGSFVHEKWFFEGDLHRLDGPARRWSTGCDYAFLGQRVEDLAEAGRELAKLDDDRARVLLTNSRYGVLLDEHDSERVVEILGAGVMTLEGIREVIAGAPAEWVRSFEEARP